MSDFSLGAAFIDGDFCPLYEAKIPIVDWGFSRGDATYDTVHVWRGAFFRLDDHLDRFERSRTLMRYTVPFDRGQIVDILHECCARANLQDAYVQMLVTRGQPDPQAPRDPRRATNRFVAFARPFIWILPQERQQDGMHLRISSIERIRSQSVDPTVKNFHWLDLVRGLFDAYDNGSDNVVLTDGQGNVLEGPGFNLFVVRDGQVRTPDLGVLAGVTRMTAMQLLAERGHHVIETVITADELRNADEAFATSTAGGIMTVSSVDGTPLGDGRIGKIAGQLLDDYWAAHERPEWHTAVRYREP
jgi:branched-chain amino acid aminotransferase